MILSHSEHHQALINALEEAETSGQSWKWNRLLKEQAAIPSDPFLAVLDYGVNRKLFSDMPFSEGIDSWLLGIEHWRQQILEGRLETQTGSEILLKWWENLNDSLIASLRHGRLSVGIPKAGGILVFTGGLAKCLILNYEIIGDTASLHLVSIIDNPISAFDFWSAIDQADVVARNTLKNILGTGHKLVFHRGVLLHVDRRSDLNVFGPSIDTLLLAELLAQDVLENSQMNPRILLEVGCGNGLLTTLANSFPKILDEIFAVDISFNAIACTARNITANSIKKTARYPAHYLVLGPFKANVINRKFDLIVCNPPYIPIPPRIGLDASSASYFQAVAGTELMTEIVSSADRLLSPGGAILIMNSSLSTNQLFSAVPRGFEVARPLGESGFEVLFDVEAVLNNEQWLSYLVQEHGLTLRDGFYFHRLHPVWIKRNES